MNAHSVSESYGHDHDQLDELFKRYHTLKRMDYPAAKDSFRQFKKGLERHILWEEEILFPRFEEKTGMSGAGPTEVMRMEHRQIKDCLRQIVEKVHANDSETDAEECALWEVLSAHNDKEESILYPAIDGLLDDQERRDVFAEMETVSAPPCGCHCDHAHAEEPTMVDVRIGKTA